VAAHTLMIYQNTELDAAVRKRAFVPLEFSETLEELEILIANVGMPARPVVFRANHPSNSVALGGTLPEDTTKLLEAIRRERAGGKSTPGDRTKTVKVAGARDARRRR
jgi:hypothetical protein